MFIFLSFFSTMEEFNIFAIFVCYVLFSVLVGFL